MNQPLQMLRLKKNESRRLRQGHVWIFSNEVNTQQTPLHRFQPGECVVVEDAAGHPLGIATINPNTLLCGRLLTRDHQQTIDTHFFVQRLKNALQKRQRFFSTPYYRCVFGESDDLPGLIIDRFDQTVVIQCNTAGMQQLLPILTQAVIQVLTPKRVLLKNDSRSRTLEGLEPSCEWIYGDAIETIPVIENNCHYFALAAGQKTGWYYDHRCNRQLVSQFCSGKSVLDVFSYVGGFGILCAKAGATQVLAVDSSQQALNMLQQSAEYNHLKQIETACGEADEILHQLSSQHQQFDMVILDPPAFIQRLKDKAAGLQGYIRYNQLALRLLKPGGLLLSASCSMHCSQADLLAVLQKASNREQMQTYVTHIGHQGPDHPIHPAVVETQYLKALMIFKQ